MSELNQAATLTIQIQDGSNQGGGAGGGGNGGGGGGGGLPSSRLPMSGNQGSGFGGASGSPAEMSGDRPGFEAPIESDWRTNPPPMRRTAGPRTTVQKWMQSGAPISPPNRGGGAGAGAGAAGQAAAGAAKGAGALGAAAQVAAKALEVMTTWIKEYTQYLALESSTRVGAIRSRETMSGEAAWDRYKGQKAEQYIPIFGSLIKAIYDYKAATKEITLNEMNAVQGRGDYLGQYNPQIARANAQNQMARTRRDIAEGQLLGPSYAEWAKEKQRLDAADHAVIAVDNLKMQDKSRKEMREQRIRSEEKFEKSLKGLSAEQRKLARDIIRGLAKSPMEKILEGLQLPTNDLGQRYADQDTLNKIRDAQVALPVFGGNQ